MLKWILGNRDRGEGAVSHLAVISLVASVAAAVITSGAGGQISSSTSDAVCQVVQGDGCADVRAGGTVSSQAEGDSAESRPHDGGTAGVHGIAEHSDGGDEDDGDVDGTGGCGFLGLGCAGRAVGSFGGGMWGGVKDTGTGLKTIFTTNPVTTGTALGKYLWEKSPIRQGANAVNSCADGDWEGCGGSIACTVSTMYCLGKDMVIDPRAEQQIKDGDYGEMAGRVGWNAGSMFIPLKIPGLGRLGKVGELGDHLHYGRANPSGQELAKALDELDELRKGQKAEAPTAGKAPKSKKGETLTADEALNLAENYRQLNAAERIKFLERLTPDELRDLYVRTRDRGGNLGAEILADAPTATIRKIDPDDLFIKSIGHWEPFNGKLYAESGPSFKDVGQGKCITDCWLLSVAGAVPEGVRDVLKQNPNGTVTATFDDGSKVTVTPDLPLTPEGAPMGARTPKEGPAWPAFLEKVVAERRGGYDGLKKGHPREAFELLGYDVAKSTRAPSIEDMALSLQQGDGFVVGFGGGPFLGVEDLGRGIYSDHTYSVIGADPAKGTVTLANPWGVDAHPPFTITRDEMHQFGVYFYSATK